MEIVPEEHRVCASDIRHPKPWELHQMYKPPKSLALKTSRTYFQENHRTIKIGKSTLKVHTNLLVLGHSTKATV